MVDDVPGICDVVRFILEKEGYEVRCAENGHEAVVLAYRLRPDLILLNFLMPVMDGYTALCHLKGRPILSCIKVVMHTANGNTASFQSFREDVMNKGALDCILVPFDRETILKVVKKALQPGPSPPG